MRWQPTSIRGKLLAVVGSATLAALLCALLANLIGNVVSFHRRTTAEMRTQAELLGRMTAPALEFDDRALANGNLALFDSRPGVRSAAIYDADGQLFSSYVAQGEESRFPAAAPGEGVRLHGSELWVSHRIHRGDQFLGTVFLRVHHDVAGVILNGVGVALLVGLSAMLLAFLMIRRLDRHVTGPIAAVAHAARDVVRQRDYSRRVAKSSDDEVGALVLAFNDMLDEIERRTHDLEHSYAEVSREAEERQSAQQEIMRLNASLEHRVEERTADLRKANLALSTAKAVADEANRAKSNFLATMSHEIRTPMNGVIGMVDVLHQTSLKGHQVEMVDLIRESAFSLLNVIDDILDFSKIESGRLELEHAPLSLSDLTESVCVMLDQYALKKGVELRGFVDPSIPAQVMGDELRLRQILVNLVSNAVKFSSGLDRPGQVSVRVEAVGADSGHVQVAIRVADNGIGIDTNAKARLFTAFGQADSSTTRRFGGSGLGLAITQHLVKEMGGHVDLESEPDRGSTFTANLELALAAKSSAAASPALEGIGCMVVGDSSSLASDLAAYLADAGAQVVKAGDPEQARSLMFHVPPGNWVWVVDTVGGVSIDALPMRYGTDQTFRVVTIGRGAKREPQQVQPGMVTLDGNALTRRRLIRAVALAVGRATPLADLTSGRTGSEFEAPSREAALRDGRLLLVAEDNETNQQVIRRQLGLLGFAADIAADGREAYDRWRSGAYALVLTDLHMPAMDGYELTRAIRSREAGGGRRTPIVALTANALKGEADRCRVAGMDGYLSKPLQLVDLRAMLEARLPGSTMALYPRTPTPSGSSDQPVDINVLRALVGDDAATLNGFLGGFQDSSTQIVADLLQAGKAGDLDSIYAQAHKLKSSALTVGASALGELCARIEVAARAADRETLAQVLPIFEREAAAVDQWLRSIPAGALAGSN